MRSACCGSRRNVWASGRLPGDIVFERGNLRVYIPLATSLLLSVLLSLIFWLLNR